MEWILNRKFLSILIGSTFIMSACLYDKGEVIPPVSVEFCDSIQKANSLLVSYQCDIKPIIEAECTVGCHKQATPQGAPTFLESYDEVKGIVNDSLLLCVVNWVGNCVNPMPYLSTTKIDSLDRVIIENWIIQGMPE